MRGRNAVLLSIKINLLFPCSIHQYRVVSSSAFFLFHLDPTKKINTRQEWLIHADGAATTAELIHSDQQKQQEVIELKLPPACITDSAVCLEFI